MIVFNKTKAILVAICAFNQNVFHTIFPDFFRNLFSVIILIKLMGKTFLLPGHGCLWQLAYVWLLHSCAHKSTYTGRIYDLFGHFSEEINNTKTQCLLMQFIINQPVFTIFILQWHQKLPKWSFLKGYTNCWFWPVNMYTSSHKNVLKGFKR